MEPTDTVGFEFPPIEFSVLMPSPLVSFWLLVLKLHKPGISGFLFFIPYILEPVWDKSFSIDKALRNGTHLRPAG